MISKKSLVRFCISSALLLTLFLTYYIVKFYDGHIDSKQSILDASTQTNKNAAREINTQLSILKNELTAAAHNIISRDHLSPQLSKTLSMLRSTDSSLFCAAACFQSPESDDSSTVHCTINTGIDSLVQISGSSSTNPHLDSLFTWAHSSDTTLHWFEPTFDDALNTRVVMVATPIFGKSKTGTVIKIGSLFGAYTMESLSHLVNALGLGKNGYGFIISEKGSFIFHPKKEMVLEHQNIITNALRKKDPNLEHMGREAIAGKSGYINHKNVITGQDSWLIYEPIPISGWSLSSMIIKDEIFKHLESYSGEIFFMIFIATLILLSLVSTWTLTRCDLTPAVLIPSIFMTSIILIMGIGALWYTALNHPDRKTNQMKIFDSETVNIIKKENEKLSYMRHLQPPMYIPTGVYIKSIEFNSSNNVKVTGVIWQKYQYGIHDSLSKGIMLPEAEGLSMDLLYQIDEKNYQLIGWHFSTVIREKFYYTQYPIDQEDLWLRMWHKDFQKNVILVPDLESYRTISESTLPGVEEDLVLPGWNINASFYSYSYHSYNMNFGIKNYIGQEKFPELYFNVEFTRQFISPFVSKVIPLFIVLIMLYSTLALGIKKETKPLDVIMGCAALFFVVILDHISLRDSLAVSGVVYIESFYFIAYLAILLISLNAVIYSGTNPPAFITYRDNLYAKVLFWPVVLGLMYIVTMIKLV